MFGFCPADWEDKQFKDILCSGKSAIIHYFLTFPEKPITRKKNKNKKNNDTVTQIIISRSSALTQTNPTKISCLFQSDCSLKNIIITLIQDPLAVTELQFKVPDEFRLFFYV